MDFLEQTTWLRRDDAWIGEIDAGWAQGRTAFGGLIVGAAVRALQPPELPLRSVIASFIAPTGVGRASLSGGVLRAGRSVTQCEALVSQEQRPRARVVAAFGADRPTAITTGAASAPQLPDPAELPALPFIEGVTPAFTQHFEYRWAGPAALFAGGTDATIRGWIRPRSETALDGPLALALLDAWPPPVLALVDRPTPASTVQWLATLGDLPQGQRGSWFCFESSVHHAGSGYADFTAQLWDTQGSWLAGMRQLVAEFSG